MSQLIKKQQKTVWDIVYPLYLIVKCFGFAGFSVDGDIRDGKIKISLFDKFYITFALSAQLFILYLNVTLDLSLIHINSFLIDKGTRFVTILCASNVLFSATLNVIFRNRFWEIFRGFYAFDQEVEKLGNPIDHQMLFNRMIMLLGVFLLIQGSLCTTTFYYSPILVDADKQFIFSFSYSAISGTLAIFLLGFMVYLLGIQQRFKAINKCIEKHFPTEEEIYQEYIKECIPNIKVQKLIIIKLADLHDNLIDLVNTLNHCFSMQMMSAFLAIFLTNIFSTFAVYRVAVLCFVTPSEEASDFIYMLLFTYVTQANILTMFEFVFSTYCVQSRLDILNQNAIFYLKSFTYQRDWTPSVFVMDKKKLVVQISILYDILNDAVDIINELWTMELIPLYILLVVNEVLTIYLTILTWIYDLFPIETAILYNLWNVFFIPLMLTFHQGSKIADSGRNLLITIGKIVNKCQDEKVIEKLKLLEIQMLYRQPTLNSGFFVIDWTLAFMVNQRCHTKDYDINNNNIL
ncbi:unnamed protein product [Diamesa hyperborea]